MSQRDDILSGLVTSLRTWATENQKDIRRIERDWIDINNIPAPDCPFLTLIDSGSEEIIVEDDQALRCRAQLYLYGVAKKAGEIALHTAFNQLYDDCREWVLANYLPPDNLLKLQIKELSRFAIDQEKGAAFELSLAMTYVYEKAAS